MTELEWRSALAAATHEANVDGLTSAEIAALWGIPQAKATTRIRDMIQAGRVEFVGKKGYTDISGRRQQLPAYRVVG